MVDSIKFVILIPLIPLGMSLFIFSLLKSFSITVNRLTKPISFLAIFSILSSISLTSFYLIKHIEGKLSLSKYLSFLEGQNLFLELDLLTEKMIIVLGGLACSIIFFSVLKLPRREGFVMYIVNICLATSLLISGSLLIHFPI